MRLILTLLLTLFSVSATVANAENLTIICPAPSGWSFGYEKPGEPEMGVDGFAGATFTYSWKFGTNQATIITQSSSTAGGDPTKETAGVITSDDFVTFFVFYSKALWTHSYFLGPEVMIISKHATGRGPYSDSASGSIFHSKCRASLK
ncbi:MAG: hypothetical protein RJQ21_02255 [Rhodospirillales bacterium]